MQQANKLLYNKFGLYIQHIELSMNVIPEDINTVQAEVEVFMKKLHYYLCQNQPGYILLGH